MDKTYIHERADWPQFRWDNDTLSAPLAAVRHQQGMLLGRMQAVGFQVRCESTLRSLTDEVEKSSEIEGERLDREQVRSSIARRLGMETGGVAPADRHIEGIVEIVLDATQRHECALTADRLFAWHAALFATGYSGLRKNRVGAWRDDSSGPMRVVSGPIGRERTHYVAPDASRLDAEMKQLLEWFEGRDASDPVLKAALAHLWFVTVHPFDDGNGRIARAIADMALTRSENSPQRFYSMSAQIRKERRVYYETLERTQGGDLDVTSWMSWFLGCLDRAIREAGHEVDAAIEKSRFWDSLARLHLNVRQTQMLNKLLDGFEGKITTTKWAKITKCSQDTAYRDILDLVGQGILIRDEAGGRSTSYSLRDDLPGFE